MFFLLLLPFSLVAWFLGVFHARGKGSAKYGFLILLLLPIPLDLQGLVIFITAFFILGFLYAQAGSFSALFLRLRAVFGENTPGFTQKVEEKGQKARTEDQNKQNPPPQQERESHSDQERPDFSAKQEQERRREQVRKQREEEIRQQREEF